MEPRNDGDSLSPPPFCISDSIVEGFNALGDCNLPCPSGYDKKEFLIDGEDEPKCCCGECA